MGLRGSHQAKIDEKGRLKLPSSFRADIESTWKTPSVYLTCDDAAGQYVRIYPMPVWEEIEQRLLKMPSTDPARRRFQRWTSLWGQVDALAPLRTALLALTALLAVFLAFRPRRKSLVQVAALSAALIIAVGITMNHWFYLYIDWFYPLLLVALAAVPARAPAEPEPSPARRSRPVPAG